MIKKVIIGVMGPGLESPRLESPRLESPKLDTPGKEFHKKVLADAYLLGKLFAVEGWLTLSGGRNVGVMDAVSRGAKEHGGMTIGILPDEHKDHMSSFIDIPILTGMGSARNNINVLTADIVVACGMGAGTLSEIALAIKAGKAVIMLHVTEEGGAFLHSLDKQQLLHTAYSAFEVKNKISELLDVNT